MKFDEPNNELNELSRIIVDAAFKVHSTLGPGLLESVYEACLCHEISKRGVVVARQVEVPVIYDGLALGNAFRIDILVDDKIVVELKAVDKINNLHEAQLLTYLKLTDRKLGLIINFNSSLIKNGIKRMIL